MRPELMLEDEQVHMAMHTAELQQNTRRFRTVPANVASYDPRTHRVTCIVPSYIDPLTGAMKVTGWIQLETPIAGNGWGIQYAPFGGASQSNPGVGELVFLNVVDTDMGSYVVSCMAWNSQAAVPLATINAGEIVLRDAAGNTVYFTKSGELNITGANTVNISGATTVNISGATTVNISGSSGVNVSSSSEVSVTAPSINMGASGQTLNALVTSSMESLFNGHTHPTPSGQSGPPSQSMGSGQLTTTVKGG